MIPSIEKIVEDLLAGTITKQQAIGWLHQHAEGAANDLRDHLAGQALASGLCPANTYLSKEVAGWCYMTADAMLAARDGDAHE